MNQPRRRASLLTRIAQTQERARTTPHPSPHERRREPSFVERYRGTEWETPSSPVIVADEVPARGQVYVWLTLSAIVGTTALLIGGSIL